ncbi:MAG: hypothetical protein Ct9H300mP1_11590 [Planctomycetaceae bacterium]|nr:MAG: hypothetical protein Ct9H300mP1_11590 [Planctomycetaceae bacterium]
MVRHSGVNQKPPRRGGIAACTVACVSFALTGVFCSPRDPQKAPKTGSQEAGSQEAGSQEAGSQEAGSQEAGTSIRSAVPPGFVPPPPLPQVMALNNPLLTPKDELAFRRKGYSTFMKAVRSPGLGSKAQQDIRSGIRWLVARLTMPTNREALPVRRREIRQMVQLQVKGAPVREFVLRELTLALSELLETPISRSPQQRSAVSGRGDPS